MKIQIMLGMLMLILTACGGASGGGSTSGGGGNTANPYADFTDGVHVLSFSCSNSTVFELSTNPTARSLKGILGGGDYGHYTNATAALCSLSVVSIKSGAGRAYDVIITSANPTSVTAGHAWPYSSFPLCVGSTDLTTSADCVTTGETQTDVNGLATINMAVDYTHTFNGNMNLSSTLERNAVGNSYTGTNQEFAIFSGFNETWVDNNGTSCSEVGFGSCTSGGYTGFVSIVSPTDFSCTESQSVNPYVNLFNS
jgi:hypothetical protein